MIYITEEQTKKCAGITSLFVSFNYNPDIINAVKILMGSNYDKRTKIWEVPIVYLSNLLDSLTEYDDISVKLLPDVDTPCQQYDIKPMKTDLLEYQKDAVEYGLNMDSWLLLDGMGLGKTIETIALAYNLKEYKGLEHCLVVCGVNSAKTNWKREIEKHSDLTCRILGETITKKGKHKIGSVKQRLEQLQQEIPEFFIITNIETLRDKAIIKELNNPKAVNKIDMIAVDEIHHCKSSQSIQGKNLLALTGFKYRLGLTGTLLLNNPIDCYTPLSFIGAERGTLSNYRYVYTAYINGAPAGYHNLDMLKYQLSRCSLRRTKDVVDLPPKTVLTEYVDMDTAHRQFYDNVKDGIKQEVDKVKLNTASVVAMLIRLRQATVFPSILTTEPIVSSKIERCVDMARQIVEGGEKLVIFSTFKEPVYEVAKQLQEYGVVVATGNESSDQIDEAICKLQTDDSTRIFVGTWSKCGTGITLTAASSMIFLDTAWTNAEFVQNQDRIYRIGTNRPVTIYNLVCTDTVDEFVLSLVNAKGAMSDYVIDDKMTDTTAALLKQYILDLD